MEVVTLSAFFLPRTSQAALGRVADDYPEFEKLRRLTVEFASHSPGRGGEGRRGEEERGGGEGRGGEGRRRGEGRGGEGRGREGRGGEGRGREGRGGEGKGREKPLIKPYLGSLPSSPGPMMACINSPHGENYDSRCPVLSNPKILPPDQTLQNRRKK